MVTSHNRVQHSMHTNVAGPTLVCIMTGLPVGYPLVVDINLANRRTKQTLDYMKEGFYFDRCGFQGLQGLCLQSRIATASLLMKAIRS